MFCKYAGCTEALVQDKKGWCHGHHTQQNRGYELSPILRTVEEKFWSRVEKDPETGCWNWVGSTNGVGYGEIRIDYKKVYAHRLSYSWEKGKLRAGFELDHMCHNPPCVNPKHLREVTHRENMNNLKRHKGKVAYDKH